MVYILLSCILLITKVFVKISEVKCVGLQRKKDYVKQQACDLTTRIFWPWKGEPVLL